MVILFIVLAGVLLTGIAVAETTSRHLDALSGTAAFTPAERLVAGAVAGLAMWLAAMWTVAALHLLNTPVVYLVAAAFLAAGVAAVVRKKISFEVPAPGALAWLLPVALWVVFILWRGAVLPPQSHDALAYHLPKAAMMVQAQGFEYFTATDPRITTLPANYELLLAGVMLLTGSDRLVEWMGTLTYLLVLLVAAAMAQRWWKERAATAATILATAMTPLFLLHSGADKNDLLSSFLCAAAVMWGAKWVSRADRTSMLLLVLSLVLAAGTKPNAAAIAAGLAPFLAWRATREWKESGRPRFRNLGLLVVFCVLAFVFCGGGSYISNWRHAGAVIGVAQEKTATSGEMATIRYGDFQNLWQVPYLLLSVPFSSKASAVWVPWTHEYWFWPRYEIYFSHYGVLFTLLVVLAPFAAIYHSRTAAQPERLERFVALTASLIAMVIMLPVIVRPVGFFGAFTRYLAFAVPVVVAGTVPLAIPAGEPGRSGRRAAVMAVLLLLFVWQAVDYGTHDRFAPFSFVRFMAAHPGRRDIFFNPNRAASVADRVAGPDDTIAVYGSFDTWVYPAYGEDLTRHVVYLRDGTTPDQIPPAVQWVIIDRSWTKLWGSAKMTNTGKFWTVIGRGTPGVADRRPYELLRQDRRFKLLFRDEGLNQALFWRIGSTPAPPHREDLLPHDPHPGL